MMALNFDIIYLFEFLVWGETMRNDEERQFCVIKKTSCMKCSNMVLQTHQQIRKY
jgi:hypothetical protein